MVKFTCGLCGELHNTIGNNAPSTIVITVNHDNAEHDGTKITLDVCDPCVNWLLDSLQDGAGIGGKY